MKQLACPRCRTKLGYRDQHIGKRVRCPGCSARFRLTAPGAKERVLNHAASRGNTTQTATAVRPARRMQLGRHARRTRKQGPSWGLLAGVFVGLLLITGVAVGGAVWWKASNHDRALALVQEKPAAPGSTLKTTPGTPNKVAYSPPTGYGGYGGAYGYGKSNGEVQLLDRVTSNAKVADEALNLTFVNSKGENVDLQSYRGQKNLVLVMTRGFPGYVCPICSAQTSRLIMNYAEFAKRDAEVLVVFPSSKDRLPEFLQACQSQAKNADVPFPILLDEDLRVVEQLGIKADLAKPSTYIVDKKGQVRFAYVGATATDRPSVKAMLEQLDSMGSL
jgi:peroxiredoxin/DNA-directed RNA polymerase subunit RPC12/RpoP